MSAAKKTAEAGERGSGGAPANCTPEIVKVVITWCDENCDRWEQEIDLSQCDGLVWKDTAHGKPGPGGGGNPKKPRVPKKGTAQRKGRCQEGPPGGPSYCWFNGSSWVCPDGL